MKKIIFLILSTATLESANNKSPITCYIFNGGSSYIQQQYNGLYRTATYHNKHKAHSSTACTLEAAANSSEHGISRHGKADYRQLHELFLQ